MNPKLPRWAIAFLVSFQSSETVKIVTGALSNGSLRRNQIGREMIIQQRLAMALPLMARVKCLISRFVSPEMITVLCVRFNG